MSVELDDELDKHIKQSLGLFGLSDVNVTYVKSVTFDDDASQAIYTGEAKYKGKKVYVVVKWGDAGAWFALFDNELSAKHYAKIVDYGWDAEKREVEVVFFNKIFSEPNQKVKIHKGLISKHILSELLYDDDALRKDFKEFLMKNLPEWMKGAEICDAEDNTVKKIAEIITIDYLQFYGEDEVIVVIVNGVAKTEDGKLYVFWDEKKDKYTEVNTKYKGVDVTLHIHGDMGVEDDEQKIEIDANF